MTDWDGVEHVAKLKRAGRRAAVYRVRSTWRPPAVDQAEKDEVRRERVRQELIAKGYIKP